MALKALDDIIARQNKYSDSLLYSFESNLRQIVQRAQGRVIAQLQKTLATTGGAIDATPGNVRVLRNAGKLFMRELDDAGYGRLANAFAGEFNGTLVYLQETLEVLGKDAGYDWRLDFTGKDLNLLAGVQAGTVAALEGAIESIAGQAVTRGLFGVGGLKFGTLVETLTDKLQTSTGRAKSIADTGMQVFHATAADRAFQIIQNDLPELVLKYRYSGPEDALMRPFCEHLLEVDKGYTRERIAEMDNYQLPNVFITRGGWNCRHQWILDTRDLEKVAPVTKIA